MENTWLRRKGIIVIPSLLVVVAAGFAVMLLAGCAKPVDSKAVMETAVAQVGATYTAEAKIKEVVALLNATQTALVPTATLTPVPTQTPTPTAEPPLGSTRVSPVDNMVSLYIPAGTFLMGTAPDAKMQPDEEKPQHTVFLDGYWIDRVPVTVQQYHLCIDAKACKVLPYAKQLYPQFDDPKYAQHPVVYINWFDAQDYCKWVGGRLPTEAEWEKAARGTDGRLYPWGNDPPDPTRANFNKNFGSTSPVGSLPAGASPYGLLDMSGNVRQWVADWYGDVYYQNSPDRNPLGPDTGKKKVLRGGGWDDPLKWVRSASRLTHVPDSPGQNRGFRCVRGY